MRILVTGSREWSSVLRMRTIIRGILNEYGNDVMIVHGDARGADRLAAQIAAYWGAKTEAHPADWKQHGKAAGFIRNQQMVNAGADLALAFFVVGAPCRGTRDCQRRAVAAGIPVRTFSNVGG